MLNGLPYRFTGVNAYEAATYWGINAGCGPMLSDADLTNLFSQSLKVGQVVRFWAFQALATNKTTKQLDWTGIDRVINTASRYGVKVIPALSGQSGGCDDHHWKDPAWYTGGYMNVYDPARWPDSSPLSYYQYMQAFLTRYGGSPTIAMIELVSEPSPTEIGYKFSSTSGLTPGTVVTLSTSGMTEMATVSGVNTAAGFVEFTQEPNDSLADVTSFSATWNGGSASVSTRHYMCSDPVSGASLEGQSASALRSFWDTVGVAAKKLDPNHLFESGHQGVGQCGAQDQGCTTSSWTSCSTHDYEFIHASAGVDVASDHDYVNDTVAVPSFLQTSIGEAIVDGKPIVTGESGIRANVSLTGCPVLLVRTTDVAAKLAAQLLAGVSGFEQWDWKPGSTSPTTCSYDVLAGDPVLATLQQYG